MTRKFNVNVVFTVNGGEKDSEYVECALKDAVDDLLKQLQEKDAMMRYGSDVQVTFFAVP